MTDGFFINLHKVLVLPLVLGLMWWFRKVLALGLIEIARYDALRAFRASHLQRPSPAIFRAGAIGHGPVFTHQAVVRQLLAGRTDKSIRHLPAPKRPPKRKLDTDMEPMNSSS
jgi:hypothetical protein